MLEEMTWKKEHFAEFDRLYDEGEYDKLCDAVSEAGGQQHNVYEWEHLHTRLIDQLIIGLCKSHYLPCIQTG